MGHKSNFLSSPEPKITEEKTTAQKNDERLPEAMRQPKDIAARYSETDERPAIEQTFYRNEVKAQRRAGKAFTIDESFEKEMHARSIAEHEAREKTRKQQEAAKKAKDKAVATRVAEEIKQTQSLDPEEIKRKNIEKERAENAEKLYPDPISTDNEVEEELWRKRADKGDQIAKRAKLVDMYDSKLHQGIMKSFIFQILGVALIIIPTFFIDAFSETIQTIITIVALIGFIFGFITLRQAAQKYRNSRIPSDQESAFVLASIIPFVALRMSAYAILLPVLATVPFVGVYLALAAGVLIGSNSHYLFLNKYSVNLSLKIILLNIFGFIVYEILPILLSLTTDPNPSLQGLPIIYTWGLQLGLFAFCDFICAKLSSGHYS